MSIIIPEMINEYITHRDLLPLSFLKMSAYTGSKRSMNYKMAKTEVPVVVEPPAGKVSPEAGQSAENTQTDQAEGKNPAAADSAGKAEEAEPEMKTVLRVWVWFTPFAFDVTDESAMTIKDFEFDDAGIDAAIEFLNGLLKSKGI